MKRLAILIGLLLPLATWAQVNTDLFDTGFHTNSAIGQLEEMSGQSISGSSYSSSSYSGSTSGSSYHSSGTTGANAIRDAKSKFKKPSARTSKYRPPRPSKAEREAARKLDKWNSRSKKTRERAESAQRYARTSNYKLKDISPLPEHASATPIPRMIIRNNVPQHITLDYPVFKDTVWNKLPGGMLEGTVRESKYFAFGAIPGEEGWFNEFRFTNPTEKELTVRVEYEVKYGKDGTTWRETKTVHMPPARINEPSVYNNSLGVYTDDSLRYRILNVTKL